MKPLLLILLLSACSTIDYENRVEGWPVLREEVRVVSSAEMHKHCDKYAGVLESTFACAEIFFKPPICKIWITEAGGWIEKHERAHCAGYDHPGSKTMRTMLTAYKRAK